MTIIICYCDNANCMYVRICLSDYLFVCLCLSGLIQYILWWSALMAFWPYWQPSSNKLAIFVISWIIYLMLFMKINSSSSSSTNRVRRRVTSLMRPTTLPLGQTANLESLRWRRRRYRWWKCRQCAGSGPVCVSIQTAHWAVASTTPPRRTLSTEPSLGLPEDRSSCSGHQTRSQSIDQ